MTARDWANFDWFALTKFQPPRLREDVISRPRLLATAYEALVSHPVTLLSAPAGYGKTTLLAELAQSLSDLSTSSCIDDDRRAVQGLLLAWLSLEEEDNDPTHFLSALVASLRRADPKCGATAQSVISSLSTPSRDSRRVVGVLINDVVETVLGPLVLVLEDLHFISEAEVYGALDYLIERMPPQMRLMITSRHDPPLSLARLRARGQLAELRLADLRFSLDETGAFLNEKQRLELGSADLVALHSRAEGWPAGLRLLAGSLGRMASVTDRSAFVRHLARTDRHVFDFLADEVLKRQESEMRAFLLETSILPELTPALCQAVTGRSDASVVLEELNRRNLFLVALDEVSSAYRFHALFAEFLRERLAREMPGRIADLHRRAAEAERHVAPMRAIPHYLAG